MTFCRFFTLLVLSSLFSACSFEAETDLATEISTIENGLLTYVQLVGEPEVTYSIEERMDYFNVPGVSIAIIEDGAIKWAKGYGIANTADSSLVDVNTMFQAGSISKPVAALAALKLFEEGKVDLDTDVNEYLATWKLEENDFMNEEKVTLRRLLTHTAGTTVHGFPGYQQTDSFPSINDVLDGNGNTPKIFFDTIPGSIWRYSGGGYTIMEKVVEDVSGQPLENYVKEVILDPLGMTNSTYQQPLPIDAGLNASAAYTGDGELIEGLWHNYPEQAAAGLWTTPTDLAKYCIAVQEILTKNKSSVLSLETIELMLTKHKNDWGLGPGLRGEGDSLIFQHGGKNAGFTNRMTAFAYQGKGLIIMTNADRGGELINEIVRSVSNYYEWGLSNRKTIELLDMTEESLTKFEGEFIYAEQVPGIGDYLIEIYRKDGRLMVNDENNGQLDTMGALNDSTFVDINDGEEMVFRVVDDTLRMVWNGRFKFTKVEK